MKMKIISFKKKVYFIIGFLFLLSCAAYSQSFTDCLKKFENNQNKIKTFIGRGNMTILLLNAQGEAVKSITSALTVYMKQPDAFKLVVDDGNKQSSTVQKADLISQKISGMDGLMTNKVDESNNLAKRFFFLNFSEEYSNAEIISSSSYEENGKTYLKFRIKQAENSYTIPQTGMGMTFTIDFIDIVFNENGLFVKSSIFSKNAEIIKTELTYTNHDGIFAPGELKVSTVIGTSRMENVITYDAVTINSKISDKEFEL